MRGKAARNDTYNTYEPWENPGVYGGIIWFNSKDHDYRLSRNFQKDHVLAELLNEDTKELADIDEVGLEKSLEISVRLFTIIQFLLRSLRA